MKLKLSDQVVVIAGKNKGKTGKIIATDKTANRVTVEKINMQVRFKKKSKSAPGQRFQKEGPIDVSNVMLVDPKTGKPTRIGYRFDKEGNKQRYAKKSGEILA